MNPASSVQPLRVTQEMQPTQLTGFAEVRVALLQAQGDAVDRVLRRDGPGPETPRAVLALYDVTSHRARIDQITDESCGYWHQVPVGSPMVENLPHPGNGASGIKPVNLGLNAEPSGVAGRRRGLAAALLTAGIGRTPYEDGSFLAGHSPRRHAGKLICRHM